MKNPVYLKDGDNLSIIVNLEPSVWDPAGEYPAISQSFRVVANGFGQTLELVPLAANPTLLTQDNYRPENS